AILFCESRCPEIPNFVSVNPELRVFQYLGLVYFLPLSGQLLFWPGKGFAETMSSALTHPGVPTAKRVLARDARSRAVLLSLRRGEIGLRVISLSAIGHRELGVAERRLAFA